MQYWPQGTFMPFMDELVKKGFIVSQPQFIQQMQVQSQPLARKGTTTSVGIDYNTRRVVVQITNEVTSPNENVMEILSVLTKIGFPPNQSIERIEITGSVIIKIQDSGLASSFVPKIVKAAFVDKINKIFGRNMKPVGIRLTSEEDFSSDVSKSPFSIDIEPSYTDIGDTTFQVTIIYLSSDTEYTKTFLKSLYDTIKKTIIAFENE
jgi:hypothetical protein